ncbi:MAG: hypothetical protein OHK0012_18610 [Synechococcales cyanobacterium]
MGGIPTGAAPDQALVLGGVAGWRRRLWHPQAAVRLNALAQAQQWGDLGIPALIELVQVHPDWGLRFQVWKELSQWPDANAQEACRLHRPFRPLGEAAEVIRRYQRGERNFSYGDLEGHAFDHVRLGGSCLDYAHARRSQWVGANLNGASLRHTDLRQADLSGAKLSGASLVGADLRGARLVGCLWSGTNLRLSRVDDQTQWDAKTQLIWQLQNQLPTPPLPGVDLSKADLQNLDWQGWDLSGANLVGVDLRGTVLVGTQLTNANLQRADLRSCDCRQADLRGSLCQRADLRGANFQDALLQTSDVSQADLRQASLIGARIEGMKHEDTRLEGVIYPDGTRLKPWWW